MYYKSASYRGGATGGGGVRLRQGDRLIVASSSPRITTIPERGVVRSREPFKFQINQIKSNLFAISEVHNVTMH